MNNEFMCLDSGCKQHQSEIEVNNLEGKKFIVDLLGDGYDRLLESDDDILGYKVKNGIVCDECAWNGVNQEELENGRYETITRKDTLDDQVVCDACGRQI